jgi:hypothetical protein
MEDEFEILAAKVLANEATPEEQSRLRELLARNPALRLEFADLEAAWEAVRAAGPVAEAVDAPPAPLPAERLNQLLKAVTENSPVAAVVAAKQREHARASKESGSPVLLFWRWFRGNKAGVPPLAVSAALLLAMLLGGAIFLNRLVRPSNGTANGSIPVAFFLAVQGNPEVRRGGALIPNVTAAAIRSGDEIHLAPGTQVSLITSNGITTLHGPQRLSGGAVVTQAGTSAGTNAANAALRTALFSPVRQLPGAGLLVATRGGETIPLYSPMGATVNLTPLVLWKAGPGRTYDLQIVDEFDAKTPPWHLNAVSPPVDFSKVEAWKNRALARNGLYRLRLNETGKLMTACEYTFRTLEGVSGSASRTPGEKLFNAVQIMASAPSRIGDALADLLTLPPEIADSELVLRLTLLAFGQLGYSQDFNATSSRLARLSLPTP